MIFKYTNISKHDDMYKKVVKYIIKNKNIEIFFYIFLLYLYYI